MYKKILLLIMVSTLMGCGGGDGEDGSNVLSSKSCDKPINSKWEGINTTLSFDLRDLKINVTQDVFTDSDGCEVLIKLKGNEFSGRMIFSSNTNRLCSVDHGLIVYYGIDGSTLHICLYENGTYEDDDGKEQKEECDRFD